MYKVTELVFLGILGLVASQDVTQFEVDHCTIPSDTNDCGAAGKWKNELGSVVEFTCQNNSIWGKYKTAVGQAKEFYPLSGRYTTSGLNGEDAIMGWSVSWNNAAYGNSNSTTSWTGIYYAKEEMIYTQWILVRYETRPNLWQASFIGHDEFTRTC